MVEKSLDKKIAEIRANPNSRAFIICDAKDADMARGVRSCGPVSPEYHHGEVKFRNIHEYRDMMRQVVRQGIVDIMLMSASSNEVLTIQERLFDNSRVTPAGRVNDTTDIHTFRGSSYASMASRPFRTATIDHLQCGKMECGPEERHLGTNLGLYSMTFNNDLERDVASLEAFKNFRLEAEAKNFRYFLEVFDPNIPGTVPLEKIGDFVNDAIVRSLAGVTLKGRPLFLKMVYHGPKSLEELVSYDSSIIVGILGGSAGTTYDAFKLIADTQKYGGRVALFGRKINNAEDQLVFIKFLRMIVDGEISAEEGVKAYHAVLKEMGIRPIRSLEDDMKITDVSMSYAGGSTVSIAANPLRTQSAPAAAAPYRPEPAKAAIKPRMAGETEPDFSKMTLEDKLEYNQRERDRIFG
ncbi:MAG: hypothetical protein AB1656_15605 [Candidatus Omnitrophota bacterium]